MILILILWQAFRNKENNTGGGETALPNLTKLNLT